MNYEHCSRVVPLAGRALKVSFSRLSKHSVNPYPQLCGSYTSCSTDFGGRPTLPSFGHCLRRKDLLR
ncbi:unnamed protein product [Gemmata massiliana]|uniref:Uncharacterized protein n=1 Tax=Gemmata massiliana TaxID=1210884 RepID=A0A6P2CYZ0_9BACT|nr:unnamed protein product [Gemmata massiliana]